MDTTRRAWLTVLLALLFAGSPLLVQGFDGYDLSAFPVPMDEPPLQPAAYAFSIWGPIYLWLVAMAVFGAVRRTDDPGWDATRVPVMVSFGIGAVWLWVAERMPVVATVLIWAMLLAAVIALTRTPRRDRWLLRAPLGLYAGWLTGASVVSTATVVVGYGWNLFGPVGWALAMLSVAFAVAAATMIARPTVTYAAALLWALLGVIVSGVSEIVAIYALIGAAMVVTLVAMQWRRVVAPDLMNDGRTTARRA